MKKKYYRKRGPVNSKKQTVDGITFASGLEKYMYQVLKQAKIQAVYEGHTYEIFPGFMFDGFAYERCANGKGEYKDRGHKKILNISYTPDFIGRGFIIELSAAITVIIASRTELPVSTTHCQVGSVVGCGLSAGTKNVQWKLLKGILWSWFITVPITGFLSAALFSYGYFAPSPFSSNTTYLN